MVSKLPRWVWFGAGVLAFNAGMINTIALMGFAHQAATHVTGMFSRLSMAIVEGDLLLFKGFAFIIGAFFLGSVISGIIIRDAHLRMGRRYGFALAVECVLLLLSTYGFYKKSVWGEYFACTAAGLQNAIATTYSGTIIRTTHLTGVVTDLGILIGNTIQRIPVETKRIKLFLIIIGAFILGGIAAGFAYRQWTYLAMLFPAVLIGFSSAGYSIIRAKTKA